MKIRLWGTKTRLLTFSLLSICFGCGAPSPQTAAPKQAQGSQNAAEVSQAFSGFDSAVEEQVASVSTNPSPAVQATSAQLVPNQSVETPLAAPVAAISITKQSVPAPTAEQLRRWAVVPFERLQLLACRDSGKAGFVTNTAAIVAGETYALAGNRLTAWSLDKDEPTHDFSDPANEQLIKSLRASPDGKWLASGDGKGNLQIWDLPDFKQRISKKIYPSGVAHLSIPPDSLTIATASFSGEVTIWGNRSRFKN